MIAHYFVIEFKCYCDAITLKIVDYPLFCDRIQIYCDAGQLSNLEPENDLSQLKHIYPCDLIQQFTDVAISDRMRSLQKWWLTTILWTQSSNIITMETGTLFYYYLVVQKKSLDHWKIISMFWFSQKNNSLIFPMKNPTSWICILQGNQQL